MRRILALFLALAALPLHSESADVSYVEGDATLRRATGKTAEAQIGDLLQTGDGLRTGRDGTVELDQGGVLIRVTPQTVFTLMERASGAGTASVLSVALGSLKIRYDRITGREPLISTNAATAGIRGTELTVWSGADGSTLIAVDAGLVTVEAEGVSVELAANEAVEVPLGRAPGEKIVIQRDQIDYATWNQGKLDVMLADPVAGIRSVRDRMAGYIAAITESDGLYRASKALLDQERANRVKINDEKGKDEADKYERDVVEPLIRDTRSHFLNTRYNVLAALSLRRYVAGRLYVMLKPLQMTVPDDPTLGIFLSEYRDLLGLFEGSVALHLVDADT